MSKNKNYLEGLKPETIGSLKEKGYYTIANKLFEKKENKPFDNGEPAHALWGMYKLFEAAEQSINIYSGKLKEQINGVDFYANTQFLKMVEKFLNKSNSTLNIISEEEIDESHPFVKLSKSKSSSDWNISIKKLKKEKYIFGNHFIVADNIGYRYELEENNGKTPKAEFNFNDAKSAQTLTRIFDILKTDSE